MRLFGTLAAWAFGALLWLHAPPAHAEGLTSAEQARLAQGRTVTREETVERGNRHYVGGLTYTVVDATAGQLSSIFEDVAAYRRLFPRTKSATLVASRGRDRFIELRQGNALVEAAYTIRVRTKAPDGPSREYRFWLEPSRPHAIDDAWGFFRLAPFVTADGTPKVLLTYGILVDLGPGLVRELFEERLRAAMLTVPQLVRRYVAELRHAKL